MGDECKVKFIGVKHILLTRVWLKITNITLKLYPFLKLIYIYMQIQHWKLDEGE